MCNRKIRTLLAYIFKYYFYIFPKSSLCHDFIYNITSTNHFAMFWVKDRLVSPDRHKNLVKTKEGKKTSFVLLVGNCHTVPWHIFKLGSIEDSRIHIKKSSFKKNPNNVSKCQLEIRYIQLNYFPTRKSSPPFCKFDYAFFTLVWKRDKTKLLELSQKWQNNTVFNFHFVNGLISGRSAVLRP